MWLVFSIILVLGAALFLGHRAQGWVIFPAARALYRTPSDAPFNWHYEDVVVSVGKHTTHGWFIPLERDRGTVLFSHGNAGNLADRLESIQLLRRMGFSVLAYDYGGYGRSTGRPSESRVYADAEAMWRHLIQDRGLAPERIILFGRSLGGAATAYLASRTSPAAVVLESTFLSIPDVARGMPLGRFLAWGIRHRFPSKDRMKDIHAPLLVVHSPDDTLIPYAHGRRLFELANEPKQFLPIRGDHNDGFVQSMEVYLHGWEAFLASLFPQGLEQE